jgi:outer membrane protein
MFMKKKYVGFCLPLILMAGCYSHDPLPLAIESNNYTTLRKGEHKVLSEECTMLTLDIATETAVKNNPDFNATHHAISAAWSRYRQSLAAYFPTVSASYGLDQGHKQYSHQRGTNQDSYTSNTQSTALSSQWVIFNGLMRTMNMLASKHTAQRDEFLSQDARRLLIKSVAVAYNNVLLGKENIRISMADLDFNEKLLKETELKYEAGAVALSEVLNFRIKVNDANIKLISSKYELTTAKHILAELLGLTEGTIPDSVSFPSLEASGDTMMGDVGIYLDMALENRPDLKAFREAVKAAEYTVKSRIGAYSPVVSVDAGISYDKNKRVYRQKEANRRSGTHRGEDRYSTWQRSWNYNYGGSVSWTVFNGGDRYNRLKEAQALLAETHYDVADSWIGVISEVRQAFDTYNKNNEQLDIYSKNLDLVKRTRDLVEEEYTAGNTSLTRLNEAQRDLVAADTDLVSSMINLNNAKAQLDSATASK